MDDKRTLIAFLLVGVIFLLMPYYYEIMGIAQPTVEPDSVAEARRDSARSVPLEPSRTATAPATPPDVPSFSFPWWVPTLSAVAALSVFFLVRRMMRSEA